IAVAVRSQYEIQILRDSQPLTLTLQTHESNNIENLLRLLGLFFAGFVSFLVASIVGLSRPERPSAQLFTVTWYSVSILHLAAALVAMQGHLSFPSYTFAYVAFLLSLSPIEVATAYHFYSRFPKGADPGRFWVLLQKLFYAVFGALTAYFTYLRILF